MASSMDKKPAFELLENVDSSSEHAQDVGYDAQATKRLIRKIDIVLLPFLSLLYL
jgi:hypothetical protein